MKKERKRFPGKRGHNLMANARVSTGKEFILEWNIPDDIVARYATNMIVQRSEHEFIISFFEVKPPLLLGSPEEINEKLSKIKSVQANCVAQIIVAADKMSSFVEALQKNLEKSGKRRVEKGVE